MAMSKAPQFRTISEQQFAAYLDEAHYQWAYEVPVAGKAKVPDFQVARQCSECLCDVKERAPKSPPPGARNFDPIKGIRKLIESGRQKFAEFSDRPCAVILHNNGDCDTRLDPICIYGAMLGDPGFQFEFDAATESVARDSAKNVFLPRGGKMVECYSPFEAHDSTKSLSAIVVLIACRLPNPEYERAVRDNCRSAEH